MAQEVTEGEMAQQVRRGYVMVVLSVQICIHCPLRGLLYLPQFRETLSNLRMPKSPFSHRRGLLFCTWWHMGQFMIAEKVTGVSGRHTDLLVSARRLRGHSRDVSTAASAATAPRRPFR